MERTFDTPILLITFNRPDHTQKVFDEIMKQKPKSLFIFQDGVRVGNEDDKIRCAAVREIFTRQLEWPCELHTFYSDVNLGCGRGPATAISWFFENVNEGLIFEDDCLPHHEFFLFSEKLLDSYRNNNSISFIAGSNFQNGRQRGDGSYYFSAGHHGTWGWATWKRSWCDFDYNIEKIDKDDFLNIVKRYFRTQIQKEYWMYIFKEVKRNRFNESCWDYQFYFSCWRKKMLAIIPNKNLITNIGFDNEATHTHNVNNRFANNPIESIFPLKNPTQIIQNKKADLYLHKEFVEPYEYGFSGFCRLPFRINKRIKAFWGIDGSWQIK
jgi:hypothetical protein